jgi:TetR/AcrR family transcriptional repressor of uid operon
MKKSEEYRKEQILKAARNCFTEKGFHKTSMRAIAAEAEMSLGNIYRYYKNKEKLIESFVQSDEKELLEAFDLLKVNMGFKLILKEIFKEYIKELGQKPIAALQLEFASEALRNEEILNVISASASICDQKLIEIFLEHENKKNYHFSLGAKFTAITLLRSIEGIAIDTIIKKDFSSKEAIKLSQKLIDQLITGAKL